jgi:hypothetical protein
LAEYEKETTEWRDEKGKHKKEVRKVRNPEGGTTTTTNTTTTPNQGSGKAPNGWNSSSNSTTNKSSKSGRSPQGW